jgi:hypothetical protein
MKSSQRFRSWVFEPWVDSNLERGKRTGESPESYSFRGKRRWQNKGVTAIGYLLEWNRPRSWIGVRWRPYSHGGQGIRGLGLPRPRPRRPTSPVQPSRAGRGGAIGEQGIVRLIASAAVNAKATRRNDQVLIQPSGNTRFECVGLSAMLTKAALVLTDCGALLEKCVPVLGGPAVFFGCSSASMPAL